MASPAKEELEYESDPEEIKRSLAMRRREASDDEDSGRGGENEVQSGINRRDDGHSDESDGQGGAEEFDDDEDDLDLVDYEDEVYDYEEEVDELVHGRDVVDGKGERIDADVSAINQSGGQTEEEKKANEPFAVPTAGAFYMHDDRFSENIGGRHRRLRGGRKLWESKDERKWGHDKFEEMNMQDRHYQERRASRGRFRGRGRSRALDRRIVGGTRPKNFNSNNGGNQNQMRRAVRGRGPRKYEHVIKNSGQASLTRNNTGNILDQNASDSVNGAAMAVNKESSMIPMKKNMIASSLNSASPPFYPSSSSNNVRQKRDFQPGNASSKPSSSVVDENFSTSHTNASSRGKNAVDSIGMEKLYINDRTSGTGRSLGNVQLPSSGSSRISTAQSRVQGRGAPYLSQGSTQPVASNVQGGSGSQPLQVRAAQKSIATGLQVTSPPKTASSINSYDGEVESASETDKQKGTLVGNGKGNLQGTGRGTFLYGGKVMGATGNLPSGHGDQNFPAFFPVMQIGGQHPGGMGVPAVGMAFPGYVAHSQLGLGNSEMTWLPVLAGTGGMGATYPYLAVDGSYHTRSTGQPYTSGSSSKENGANRPNNMQRPESNTDELPQRQSNPNKQPRRYSEMNFSK